MIRLAGRRMQLWRRVGGRGGKRGAEPAFGVRFLPTRSLWGDDSWRNTPLIPLTRVTWPSGSLTFQSNLNGLGDQSREKCPYAMCVPYTVCAHNYLVSFRSSVEYGLLANSGTRRCGCVWPSLVARLDCTSRQQRAQPATHFCLSAGAKWASWFVEDGVPWFQSRNKMTFCQSK